MQKTRLGITVGLMGFIVYLTGVFGSYVALFVAAGYILLCESNEWLRKTAIKAVVLSLAFSLLSAAVNLIPSATGVISSIAAVFDWYPRMTIVTSAVSIVNTALSVLETLLFVLLGFKALTQGSIGISFIDRLIQKHTSEQQYM